MADTLVHEPEAPPVAPEGSVAVAAAPVTAAAPVAAVPAATAAPFTPMPAIAPTEAVSTAAVNRVATAQASGPAVARRDNRRVPMPRVG